jgi:hypothetical protein
MLNEIKALKILHDLEIFSQNSIRYTLKAVERIILTKEEVDILKSTGSCKVDKDGLSVATSAGIIIIDCFDVNEGVYTRSHVEITKS